MKINNILSGWSNFILKSEVTEELAKKRALACVDCSECVKSKLTAFVNDDIKQIKGYKCNICNCPLSAKLRTEKEKCPLNKW